MQVSPSLRSSLFRFLSGKQGSREGTGTEVTKKLVTGGRGKPLPLFLTFCSRPMRSRDFPLALAFSRLEETEKTATQAIIGKTFSDDVECVSKTRSRNTKK